MGYDREKEQIPEGPRGWHSRGYLPHFDGGDEFPQFVTFRLSDSVPNKVLNGWQEELRGKPELVREQELRRLIDLFLDSGSGDCHLQKPIVAEVVEGALLHFDEERYRLYAWVIMPNHVHVLFLPLNSWSISKIVGSWKSFTSKKANQQIGCRGKFWQEDYYDRFVRDPDHFEDVVTYIELNPVKAGLCSRPEDWRYGSARLKCTGKKS